MFTPVPPEVAVEIENKFRTAATIGDFVDAATHATNVMYPNPETSEVDKRVREFNADLNAALVKALGRDYVINPIPDVMLLIDDHAGVTGSVSGLLSRKYNPEHELPQVPQMIFPAEEGEAN